MLIESNKTLCPSMHNSCNHKWFTKPNITNGVLEQQCILCGSEMRSTISDCITNTKLNNGNETKYYRATGIGNGDGTPIIISSENCTIWEKVNRVMDLIGALELYSKYEDKPAKLCTQIKLTGAEIIELENRGYSVDITNINAERTLTRISKINKK